MKRHGILLLLNLLAISMSAQYVNTRLWRISGNGLTKNSYLYGSMHVDDSRAFNFSDSVFYALSRCDLFANEVAFDSVIDFVYKSLDQEFSKQLQEEYFSDDEDALDEVSQSTGIGKNSLKRLNPVVLRQLIPGISGPRKRMPAMLDSYLYNIARKEGKTCIGIESISTQIELFNKYPEALRSDVTRYTIGKNRVMTNRSLLDVYRKANLNETLKLYGSLPEDLVKALLTDRNHGMVHAIDSISRLHSAFYTIGFAHLPGNDGLIDLLRARGFQVDAVPETFNGLAESFPFRRQDLPWQTYTDSVSGYHIQFPGPSYTSPDIPHGLAHRLHLDIGTNSFYMIFSRSMAGLGNIRDLDSLLRDFAFNAWKTKAGDIHAHPVSLSGLRATQADKIPYGPNYLSVRLVISDNFLHFLMGINNQEKEMGEILRFFNSFQPFAKIQGKWNRFHSVSGGYSVDFPGNPKENYMKRDQEFGSSSIISMISGTDNLNGNEYLVQFLDYTDSYYSQDSSSLQTIQDNILATVSHQNLVWRDTLIRQFPARDIRFSLDNGQTLRVWLILRGTRAYNLISAYTSDEACIRQANDFFNSFSLEEYDWRLWKLRSSDTGAFQGTAPSEFKKEFQFNFNPKFELVQRYTSFDSLTGDKVVVMKQIFSPYYHCIPDSAFFREMWVETFESEDSVVSVTADPYLPSCWIIRTENPASHLITFYKMILHGRGLYTWINMTARPYLDQHPAMKGLDLFRVTDTLYRGNPAEEKLDMLLTDLKSEDDETRTSARNALSFYDFTAEELPRLREAINLDYKDDSLGYDGTGVALLDAFYPYADSAWQEQFLVSFDSLSPNPYARLRALQILMKDYQPRFISFIRKQWKPDVPDLPDYSFLVSMLQDSLPYAVQFYPELLQGLGDPLNRTAILVLSIRLLESGRISPSDLDPFLPLLKEWMNECLEGATEFIPDLQEAHVFSIAGYLNHAELWELVKKAQLSRNPYIVDHSLKSLIRNEQKFNRKSFEKMLKNLAFRRGMFEFLQNLHKLELMPEKYRNQSAIAECDLYTYLESEEYISITIREKGRQEWFIQDTLQRFYLFQVEAEIYGDPESFYIISGPFPATGEVPSEPAPVTGYRSSDERLSPAAHFSEFRKQTEEITK